MGNLNESKSGPASDGRVKQQIPSSLSQFDQTFLAVYGDLTHNLLSNVQPAVLQILKIAENYLSCDLSQALIKFHQLYSANIDLDQYKSTIDKNVDAIIDFVQNCSKVDALNEKVILNQLDDEQSSSSRLSLTAFQKELEALITMESDVHEMVTAILYGLQFENQLSSSISSLVDTLNTAIMLLNYSETPFCLTEAASHIYRSLKGEKDRDLFHEHVLLNQYQADSAIPLSSVDFKNETLCSKQNEQEFLSRLVRFANAILQWNNEQSLRSVSMIMDAITAIKIRTQSEANLSAEDYNSLLLLQSTAVGRLHNNVEVKTSQLLLSTLKARPTTDYAVNNLVVSIVQSIQFQDRICQNMINLGHSLVTWLASRESLQWSSSCTDLDQLAFGEKLLSLMTMNEEREIIRRHIVGLASVVVDDNEIELF